MSSKEFDVVLIGYYGFGNLGDELLAESVISLLVDGGVPRKRIAILSSDPVGAAKTFNIASANRWRISEVAAMLRKSRTLLFGGGGLFQDVTSARSSFYYWGIAKLARLFGCGVWAVGQSIGPLHGMFSRSLTSEALLSCKFLSVRDKGSLGMLNMLRLGSKAVDITPDLVLGLDIPLAAGGRSMIVNVRPWERHASLAVAETARRIAGARGLSVKYIAFASEDEEEIKNLATHDKQDRFDVIRVASIKDFIDATDDASLALGMRLHFSVLSALRGIPACAVAYDPKVSAFASEWGLACIGPSLDNIGDLDAGDFSSPARGVLAGARNKLRDSFSRGIKKMLGV